VALENLDIRFQENVLMVTAELAHEALDEQGVQIWRREYAVGKFARGIRLPDFAIGDRIDAAFEHCILSIAIPVAIQTPKVLHGPVRIADPAGPSADTQQALERNAQSVSDKKRATNGRVREPAGTAS
jgi:hypothetical protein